MLLSTAAAQILLASWNTKVQMDESVPSKPGSSVAVWLPVPGSPVGDPEPIVKIPAQCAGTKGMRIGTSSAAVTVHGRGARKGTAGVQVSITLSIHPGRTSEATICCRVAPVELAIEHRDTARVVVAGLGI